MFGVDLYRRVRFAVFRGGMSRRGAAQRFGIDRGTVSKMLKHSTPPGYRRVAEPRRPMTGTRDTNFAVETGRHPATEKERE